ncbi:substrate-binding domain-containing protein [Falsihalocynthiibacter arcticus]|uniref:LacI family transcriptional regulator n=1 Tax=Falsihalocynthiibacter arcticus TaxID=1579316 RepID=A0A126V3R1_9RHOB|nr:substrate-binding domain-containing protein [Falsihalocynthiibacter arcticus]AML52930.1 LacI family transcriptional regulator [Falsihalocynthiibacter arcticus]
MNLKSLSDILGLSQTTVSRALNGYPEVSEKTRLKVLAAARKHHYSPNTRAQSLATGRAMAIGHVIPMSNNHEMVNPIFGDFIAGAGVAYSNAGYDMLLSIVQDDDEEQAYRRMAARGSVDGIIVHGPRKDDPRVALLQEIGLPFVVHGRMMGNDKGYSWLDINNTRSFKRATDLLLDLGHRRIALLNGLETMDFASRRRAGFVEAISERGIAPDPSLMFSTEMTEQFGYDISRKLLADDNPPTAIITSSYLMAIGIRRAIGRAGLLMGRDVSVVTHDDDLSYLRNGDSIPTFTATRSSVRDAGSQCAKILLQSITSGSTQPVQELWEAELMVGSSTGPAPQR